MNEGPITYAVGGTVQAQGGVYLSRDADASLLSLCRSCTFASVLTSRQMGKSSLMIRTAQQLEGEGFLPIVVDLQLLGVNSNSEQWFKGVLSEIARQARLVKQFEQFWNANAELDHPQRFAHFIKEVLLEETDKSIVIFVDEIDSTLRLDFTDDFFVLLRYLFNARASNPDLVRISFVLLGVSRPSDLVKNPARTPYNVGQQVELTDFSLLDCAPLLGGLTVPEELGSSILDRIYYWTSGHPYLTLKVFSALSEEVGSLSPETVDFIVKKLFFGEGPEEDSNIHLIVDMLTRKATDTDLVLLQYRRIRSGKVVHDDDRDRVKSWLKLSGVIKEIDGKLIVRNKIYETVFTQKWAWAHLKDKALRRLSLLISWRTALIAALVLVFLTGYTYYVSKKLKEAQVRLSQVASSTLAIQSQAMETTSLKNSVMLAVASLERQPTARVRGLLIGSDYLLRAPEAPLEKGGVLSIAVSEKRELILASKSDGIQVINLVTGERSITTKNSVAGSCFVDQEGSVASWSTQKLVITRGNVISSRMVLPGNPAAVACNSHLKILGLSLPDGSVYVVRDGITTIQEKHDNVETIKTLLFSEDGRYLIGIETSQVVIWDLSAHTEKSLPLHKTITATAVSGDSHYLAVGGADNTVTVISLETYKPVTAPLGIRGQATAVRFSDNANLLAAASADPFSGTWVVRVWSHDTYKAKHRESWIPLRNATALAHSGSVRTLAFGDHDLTLLTASDDGSARLWALATGTEWARFVGKPPMLVAQYAGSDLSSVVTLSGKGLLQKWKLRGQFDLPVDDFSNATGIFSFGPKKDEVTRVRDSVVQVANYKTGSTSLRFGDPDRRNETSRTPQDGTQSQNEPRLRKTLGAKKSQMNAGPTDDVHSRVNSERVTAIAIDTEGHYVYAGTGDGEIEVLSPSGTLVTTLDSNSKSQRAELLAITALASTGGGSLVLTGAKNGLVCSWAIAEIIRDGINKVHVPISLVTRNNNRVKCVNGDNSEVKGIAMDDRSHNTGIVWQDGRVDFLAKGDLNAATSLRLVTEGRGVAISPDGTTLAVAGDVNSIDNAAVIWRPGTPPVRLPHEGPVSAVAYNPRGSQILTVSGVTFRIWDASTHMELARRQFHEPITSVMFSLDGQQIGILSGGRLFIVSWKDEDTTAYACKCVGPDLDIVEWNELLPGFPYMQPCQDLKLVR